MVRWTDRYGHGGAGFWWFHGDIGLFGVTSWLGRLVTVYFIVKLIEGTAWWNWFVCGDTGMFADTQICLWWPFSDTVYGDSIVIQNICGTLICNTLAREFCVNLLFHMFTYSETVARQCLNFLCVVSSWWHRFVVIPWWHNSPVVAQWGDMILCDYGLTDSFVMISWYTFYYELYMGL